eukprot:CAMPEP_0116031114 /NCGR_PEP_ID=MMETSP0321-20121206/17297_1 /TAXON_ID=163516 /ORGANISM="Leptocylindrus danicus var. danicus, Strain B650" /LENGTH=386 /DNA_ID=CAMNT_0003506129 /DNA_START=72 /DNA_END=1232 /DNA_ORIENTATION=-
MPIELTENTTKKCSETSVNKEETLCEPSKSSTTTSSAETTTTLDDKFSSRSSNNTQEQSEARPNTSAVTKCNSSPVDSITTDTNTNNKRPSNRQEVDDEQDDEHPSAVASASSMLPNNNNDDNNNSSSRRRTRFRTKTVAKKVRTRRSTRNSNKRTICTANKNEQSSDVIVDAYLDRGGAKRPILDDEKIKTVAEGIIDSLSSDEVEDEGLSVHVVVAHNKAKKTPWDVRYIELIEYKKQFGHCLVPARFKDNPPLGRWVSLQRVRHKAWKDGVYLTSSRSPAMTADQVALLESIGFAWTPVKNEWELRYQELVEYKKQYGNCLVPARYKENQSLGQWVASQRMRYKAKKDGMKTFRGGTAAITEIQTAKLNKLDFVWEVRKRKNG